MPTYKITYRRRDMPTVCQALKTAHTEKEAIACLCVGNASQGFRLKRSGVPITNLTIEETK